MITPLSMQAAFFSEAIRLNEHLKSNERFAY